MLFALLWTLSSSAQSVRTVADLYQAEVPVADQSQGALRAASQEALADVLVRVSGVGAVVDEPGLASALARANDYVQRFVYRGSTGNLRVDLLFDRDGVNALLRQAGVPIWTSTRPVALVWLGIDEPGGRFVVDAGSAPAEFAALHAAFAARGVPLQMPLGDLQDLRDFSLEELWRLDSVAAARASARYGSDEVLVGRVFRTGEGGFIGDWQYSFRGGRVSASAAAPSLDALAAQAVALVADNMVSRYAVTATEDDGDALTVTISGILDYADYAAVIALFERIEVTERVAISALRADIATLALYTRADPSQVTALLQLDKRLRALPAADGSLSFRWQR